MTPTLAVITAVLTAPAADTAADARAALTKAVAYYRTQVARHGGYVYYTGLDTADRWGEGKAGPDTVFVQPPGTPSVGLALLAAFAATGDPAHRDAAREAAEALVYGQLQSGGWTQTIHFGPAKQMGKYRNGKGGSWNASSLDDGQTQTALRLLARADQALGFKHAAIHEASGYGHAALLKAQFPNGAFPQVWTGPVPRTPDAGRAKFPTYDWKTAGRVKNYWDYYTLNDGLAGTVCDTLLTAHAVYREERYLAAVRRLGDFLLAAQLPDPQPGWSQQYSYEMVPIWARKFEPPAVSGWESQDVMRTLVRIARVTGDRKYLEPIPKACAYFTRNLLPDGRVARYYEFGSNKPLYMTGRYELTHDDADAPDHYGWKQPAGFREIEALHRDAVAGVEPKPKRRPTEAEARAVIAALDADGRWVSVYAGERLVGQPKFPAGYRYLSSEVFNRNVELLSAYLTPEG